MKSYKKENIKKILCIKPRGIGDIILSTIILDSLKAYFPAATIDYMTEPFAAPAFNNNPLVNKVIHMGRTEFTPKVAWRVRKEKYDMVLDLWSNPRTAQITFLSGIKYRVGFGYRGRSYAYNIKGTSERGKHHIADHNLELLKALDIPVVSKKIHYYVNPAEDKAAKKFIGTHFPEEKKLFGIVPSGGWASKRCDWQKWVEICEAINKKYNAYLLVISGPGDEEDATQIKNSLPDLVIHAHRTTLDSLTALFNNCDFIVANDSGPMHLAAALGKPTLGIFGPTSPFTAYPYPHKDAWVRLDELFCIECNHLVCPYHHECMRDLPVERVLNKIDDIINR
jgi:heptosyltransferase-3